MKRSEMIKIIGGKFGSPNIKADLSKDAKYESIINGIISDLLADSILKACEEAGMQPPCFGVQGGRSDCSHGDSSWCNYKWDPEDEH